MSEMLNRPEREFRVGGVRATIWKNQQVGSGGEAFDSHRVILERVYKDARGEWKTTGSLFAEDLPKAILALKKAYEHLVLHRDDKPGEPVSGSRPSVFGARVP